MHKTRKLIGLDFPPDDEINLHVKPLAQGGFGVYANEITIAVYENTTDAEAHFMRLLKQQERGEE